MAKKKPAPVDEAVYLTPTPVQVAMRNCCPRCGEGKLLTGMLAPGTACMNCGLNYEFIDAGDGPAVFVILIIGFIVTAMAMALQISAQPPLWVHLLLWIPLISVLSLWGLRFSKAIMIALQYNTSAREGELGEEE
ncbi:MAG: DUF983 domain-containing protein [Pseudomonadota bacterium]